jgi:hypothetical protein
MILGILIDNGSRTSPSLVDGSWSMLSKPSGLPYVMRAGLDTSLEGRHLIIHDPYVIDPPSRLIWGVAGETEVKEHVPVHTTTPF